LPKAHEMFELVIARRHVVSNRRGTAFTLLSVAIAVGVIIMSLGLTSGVRSQIIESTVEKNPHIIINPKPEENYIYLYRSLDWNLQNQDGVLAVSPRMVGQGAARYKDKVVGVEFVGIKPDEEEKLMAVQEAMTFGNLSDLKLKKHNAILGVKLAENLKIRPGGEFQLSLKNQTVKLKVSGLIQKGTLKDETLIYIPLETAQSLVNSGDVVSEIAVKLSDFSAAPGIAASLDDNSRYRFTSWQDFNREVARFVGTQSRVNIIFYIFILLISGFVIANTTIMVISRRTKEIGILMAMGATRRSILKIFLLENMLLSIPAGVLGCLIGFAFAKLITLYPMDVIRPTGGASQMIVIIRPEYFLYAVVFALALNFISGIYPAYAAARLDPVEAIESE
jgi:lipoprotein-releasing system permease protein